MHVDGHEEYEVESIVKHRKNRRSKELDYRVAFKGYGPERNKWLSGDQVQHCAEAIADYWRRRKEKIGARAIHAPSRD